MPKASFGVDISLLNEETEMLESEDANTREGENGEELE